MALARVVPPGWGPSLLHPTREEPPLRHPPSRPVLYMAFAAGAAAAVWISGPLPLIPASLVLLLATRGRPKLAWASVPLLCILGLGVGHWRLPPPRADHLTETVARGSGPQFLWVGGRVLQSEPWTDGCRVALSATAFREGDRWVSSAARIRAFLPLTPPLPGSSYEASLRLALPAAATNPGQFDMRKYLRREGFDLTGSCRAPELFRTGPPDRWSPLARYRLAMERRLMADGGKSGGALLAILLGERGLMDPAQVDALSVSGLYHLVALSGFNVGLLLMALAAAAHAFRIHPRTRDLASTLMLAAYGAVVASQPSLSRALLMAGVFLAARLLARPHGGLLAWSASLALLLAYDPFWVLDSGFQLTFAATLGIIVLWDAIPAQLQGPGAPAAVFRLLWVGLAAQVATLPFVVFSFHRVSLLGWLATPLASLPLMAVQVLGTAYLFGLAFVPGIHQLLGVALDHLTRLFLLLPLWLGGGRWGTVFADNPPWGWLAAFIAAGILLCSGGRWRRAGWVLAAFSIVGAWSAPALFPRPAAPSIAILDVGQASCQVLRWGTHTLLVDAGNGTPDGPSMARTVIEPYLADAGVRTLDGLILTHWDEDHAGAAPDLLLDLPVGFLAYPATDPPNSGSPARAGKIASSRGVHLIPLKRGERMAWPGLTVDVIHPAAQTRLIGENDHSLVCLAEFGCTSAYFTGDVEGAGEGEMVNGGGLSPAYALMVPHHGSATSSSLPWVQAISPRLAIFSVGRENRFGHPAAEVVERYRHLGIRMARTDRDGALLLRLGSRRPVLWRMRDGNWQAAPGTGEK